MKTLLATYLALSVLAAPAFAQHPGSVVKETPALEQVSKDELYRALMICDARLGDSAAVHKGCMDKLATRTSSVVNELIVPPLPPEPDGWGLEWLLAAGAGGVVLGVVLGLVLSGKGVTVVK